MTQSSDGHDHVGALLSGYLDGELTQQQSQLVRVHCAACPQCRVELDELAKLRERVGALAPLESDNEIVWSEKVDNAADRATRGFGWALLIVGVVGIGAWGVYEFVIDSSLGTGYKLLVGCVYVGLAILFLGVLRQRLKENKTDKYNKVEV